MKPLDFPLLADENIHPEIIEALATNAAADLSLL
jgi:hypothetical protein